MKCIENSDNDAGKSDILGQSPSHYHMNCFGIELGVSLVTDSHLSPDIPME